MSELVRVAVDAMGGDHAPEAVVARERKKESDSLEKIASLKATIEELEKK